MPPQQNKPRFIRKNGKIIPIGGKKKSGDNRTKKNLGVKKRASRAKSKAELGNRRSKLKKAVTFASAPAFLLAGILPGKKGLLAAAVGGALIGSRSAIDKLGKNKKRKR